MDRLAILVKQDLLSQIPRQGNVPSYFESTGKLKRSLDVNSYEEKGEGWTIAVSYENYGNYTNFGTTRKYAPRWKELSQKSIFELPKYEGYKRGIAGIRPQYWLSLSRQENKYMKEIEKSLEVDFDTFINKMVQNLSKPI